MISRLPLSHPASSLLPYFLINRAFAYCAVVQSLSHVRLFEAPWTAACQASRSSTIFWSLLKLMSIVSDVIISSSVIPFSSCPQSFPASGSFLMSQLVPSGGQSIGASASVLLMNMQGRSSSLLLHLLINRAFACLTLSVFASQGIQSAVAGTGGNLREQDGSIPIGKEMVCRKFLAQDRHAIVQLLSVVSWDGVEVQQPRHFKT